MAFYNINTKEIINTEKVLVALAGDENTVSSENYQSLISQIESIYTKTKNIAQQIVAIANDFEAKYKGGA